MKDLINKVKNYFKGLVERFNNKHADNDGYKAVLIFVFYLALVIAAVSFLYAVFSTLKLGGALFLVIGSYFSIRILYQFSKDFIGLIKLYLEGKKEEGEN